jgi:hypothetical protein
VSTRLEDESLPGFAPTELVSSAIEPPEDEIDLARFEALAEADRMRVIIRVLCGLVALEDEDWFSAPVPATPPSRRRLLPLLGYERAHLRGRTVHGESRPPTTTGALADLDLRRAG